MALEAILEEPTPVEKAAARAVDAGSKGLELLVSTGVNAAYAANPLRDIKNFASSAYHLLTDKWSWKDYKAELKKGKFLGKGNLANVLFTTGIVASGMYPGLLAMRAGLGAGAYLGKRALTMECAKNHVAGFLDRNKKRASWLGKYLLGVSRDKTESYLDKNTVNNEFNRMKNDRYYREKWLPTILDSAIAAKGYAGLIGLKWLAGAVGKTGNNLKEASDGWLAQKVGGLAGGVGDFTKNISSDTLSALVFAAGAGQMYETGAINKVFNGEYYEDAKDKFNYFVDGNSVQDVKHYFSSGKYKDDAAVAVTGTADSVAKFLKEKFQSAAETAHEAAKDPVAAVINPEEKYAVICAGYDIEHSSLGEPCERFVAEQCHVYKDLLDMGYKPENIKVLMPEGLDVVHSDSHFPGGFQELKHAYADSSYCHEATEANLESVLREMSTKVDGNDTFVFYLGSHGNSSYNFDDGEFRKNSYVGLSNGKEVMHDHELCDYVKDIDGEKEFYFIDACYSSGFAEEGAKQDGIWVAACTKDQPALMHQNGDSFASELVETLKQNGGIDNDTTYEQVKACSKDTIDKFRKTWEKYKHSFNPIVWIYAKDQTPVVAAPGQQDFIKKARRYVV
ncbi:hypothetical protein GF343_03190 [Candidatus Woesearchaeota archaeon]|nr:hypothetical protein [Candidatus Woesearchaeota archaeon]